MLSKTQNATYQKTKPSCLPWSLFDEILAVEEPKFSETQQKLRKGLTDRLGQLENESRRLLSNNR